MVFGCALQVLVCALCSSKSCHESLRLDTSVFPQLMLSACGCTSQTAAAKSASTVRAPAANSLKSSCCRGAGAGLRGASLGLDGG